MVSDDPGLNVLSNEVALLCLGAAGREPQYFGPSSAVPFARIVSSTLGLRHRQSRREAQQRNTMTAQEDKWSSQILDFPSQVRSTTLSEAYFSNIHP